MAIVKTVKIKSSDSESGYIIINESDYDEKTHKVYKEVAEKVVAKAESAPSTENTNTEKTSRRGK